MPTKKELLQRPIQHLDLKQHNVVPLVDAMAHMAYSARDTYRAANIYEMMLRDTDCGVILCLAGSLSPPASRSSRESATPEETTQSITEARLILFHCNAVGTRRACFERRVEV